MFETVSQEGDSMAFPQMIDPKENKQWSLSGRVEVEGGSAILAAVWPQNAAALFLATREVRGAWGCFKTFIVARIEVSDAPIVFGPLHPKAVIWGELRGARSSLRSQKRPIAEALGGGV